MLASTHIKGKTFSLGDGGGEAVKTPGKGVFDKIKTQELTTATLKKLTYFVTTTKMHAYTRTY